MSQINQIALESQTDDSGYALQTITHRCSKVCAILSWRLLRRDEPILEHKLALEELNLVKDEVATLEQEVLCPSLCNSSHTTFATVRQLSPLPALSIEEITLYLC